MGIKSFVHELKTKVSHSRFFRAISTDARDILPKACPTVVKSVELHGATTVTPGCIFQTNFVEGSNFKTAKNKVEVVDPVNCLFRSTLVEGDMIGHKLEKICYEIKFDASEDGGCVVKMKIECHTKGDHEVSNDEANALKDQIVGLYKDVEAYLVANPRACV